MRSASCRAVPDTAHTVATGATPGESPAPDAEPAQNAPLAEEIAMLNETLARSFMPRASLRDAAERLLAAWDEAPTGSAARLLDTIEPHLEALREALAAKSSRDTGATRAPRAGTKQDTVLALLARDEGATGAQIAEATG